MQDGRSDEAARYLVVGPPRHGVVVHALRLAAADDRLGRALVRLDSPAGSEPRGLDDAVLPGAAVLVQVTDRLLGPTPEHAATVVERLATRARLGLVLHDVPQPAEGGDWYARRRVVYARLVASAARIVVASGSEADTLAADTTDPGEVRRRTVVVPLPVERSAGAGSAPDAGPVAPDPVDAGADLAVLGFLYPGKGVEDAIDVAAALTTPGRPVSVTNYGAAAEGHADHVGALERYAADRGVRFRVTGYLTDDALRRVVLAADVPLAPHRHISASGSVNTWLEHGRRPVVRSSPYVVELARRLPGSVTPADDLHAAVVAALADPGSTRLAPGVVVGPSWAEAAAAHVEVLEALEGMR